MSEDLTPRQPEDETARLLRLILSRLDGIESRLAVVEERLAPTNQLPKIYAEVLEISAKVGKLDRAQMSVVELLGDLSGRSLDLDRRVRELEKK